VERHGGDQSAKTGRAIGDVYRGAPTAHFRTFLARILSHCALGTFAVIAVCSSVLR
jgi:hypothetical protein